MKEASAKEVAEVLNKELNAGALETQLNQEIK